MQPKNTNGPQERAEWESDNTSRHANRSNFQARSQCIDRSALMPARTFYEREGFTLARPGRNDWVMAKGQPPCHKSKSGRSLSVNLSHGGFQCFGCGAKGDQIKFVMLRDRCDFKAACKVLGIWREGVTADERLEITRREQEREWHRQREAEEKQRERKARLEIRDELHTAVWFYQAIDGELHRLGPQAEAHWNALPSLLDDWRLSESAYCQAARLDNPYE